MREWNIESVRVIEIFNKWSKRMQLIGYVKHSTGWFYYPEPAPPADEVTNEYLREFARRTLVEFERHLTTT